MILAEFFPHGVSELFQWRGFLFRDTLVEVNKVALMALISTAMCAWLFVGGARKKALVPTGIQNAAEMSYELIEQQIAVPVIGDHHGYGKSWTPFLTCTFFFIFFINIWSTAPFIQFPATARFGIPLFLSLVTWLVFIGVGFKHQGPFYIFKAIWPPGVPFVVKLLLVAPIEFVSKFIVRPFSLAVRLFANMVAGHILIAVFALMTHELFWVHNKPFQVGLSPLAFFMLLFMTVFELLVAVLQAYIFTTLTAVYIGESASEGH